MQYLYGRGIGQLLYGYASAVGLVLFVAIFVLSLVGIRQQSLVGDDQFLRSMIPHHSGAILMCEEAKLTDPEIRQLCGEIIQAQKDEISQMKRIMDRL